MGERVGRVGRDRSQHRLHPRDGDRIRPSIPTFSPTVSRRRRGASSSPIPAIRWKIERSRASIRRARPSRWSMHRRHDGPHADASNLLQLPRWNVVRQSRVPLLAQAGPRQLRLHRAIVGSCDVFFYNVGQHLGVDRLRSMGARARPGQKDRHRPRKRKGRYDALVRVEGEALPSSAGIRRRRCRSRSGRATSRSTPMQIGRCWRPKSPTAARATSRNSSNRIEALDGTRGQEISADRRDADPASIRGRSLDICAARCATWSMRRRHRPRGPNRQHHRMPARPALAGGQGSRQGARHQKTSACRQISRPRMVHGVCAGDHPKIAIACVIEHGGHGGSSAGPVVHGGDAEVLRALSTAGSKPAVPANGAPQAGSDPLPKADRGLCRPSSGTSADRDGAWTGGIIYHFDWTLFSMTLGAGGVGMLSVISATWGGQASRTRPAGDAPADLGRRRRGADDGGCVLRLSRARDLCLPVLCDRRRDAGGGVVAGHSTGGSRRWLNLGVLNGWSRPSWPKSRVVLVMVRYLREEPPQAADGACCR